MTLLLSFADVNIFDQKSETFVISRNNFYFFFRVFRIVLIKLVEILMMPAKLATLICLIIKVF